MDVYAALLAARSEREILSSIPASIPSCVRRFASHLRSARAADTGSPPRNLTCDKTQVFRVTTVTKQVKSITKSNWACPTVSKKGGLRKKIRSANRAK